MYPESIPGGCRRRLAVSLDASQSGHRRSILHMNRSRSREPEFDPPYDEMLRGILSFKTLARTEETINHLEILRQRFLVASDKKGVEYCRQLGVLGRRRAELIAANHHVAPQKRRQKKEAALWFRIWLETPELFPEWLVLRKRTEEFLALQDQETSP
jgi:hypothetical protein